MPLAGTGLAGWHGCGVRSVRRVVRPIRDDNRVGRRMTSAEGCVQDERGGVVHRIVFDRVLADDAINDQKHVVEAAYEGRALAREVGQCRERVHQARLQDVPSLAAPERVAADISRPSGFVLQEDRNEHRDDTRGTEEGQQGEQDRLAFLRSACWERLVGLGAVGLGRVIEHRVVLWAKGPARSTIHAKG